MLGALVVSLSSSLLAGDLETERAGVKPHPTQHLEELMELEVLVK